MSIKKPNSRAGWKSKLDELSCIPDETLPDEDASWQKLHARLQQKKRSNKTVWYWAAAVLLPILMLVIWINSGKEADIALKQPSKVTDAIVVHEAVKDTVPVTVVIKNEKRTADNVTKAPQEWMADTNIATQKETTTIAIAEDTASITKIIPITIKPAASVDTIAATVAVQPVKKKLKVVHVNELNDPVYPVRAASPGEDYSVLGFRLINQQIYSTASPSGSNINLKIPAAKKISTN
jgi:uncharacterized protein GlcG (DUF336 family)